MLIHYALAVAFLPDINILKGIMSPPVCIIGSGPVGITLAVLMSQSRDVYLVSKGGLKKIPRISGAMALKASGRLKQIDSAQIGSVAKEAEFWICTRAYDVREVLKQYKSSMLSSSGIVLCSNGLGVFLDAAFDIGRSTPLARVLFSFGARVAEEGEAVLAGSLMASVSSMQEHSGYSDSCGLLLEELGFNVRREVNVAAAEWRKAIANIIVNSLCTIARVKNGVLVEDSELRTQALAMLSEIRQVMKADGFEFPELTDEVFLESILLHADNINSTLAALNSGKKTETDYMMGRFLKIAEDYQIDVPVAAEAAQKLFRLETGN